MKKKIGILNGSPVVQGDSNEITKNEIQIIRNKSTNLIEDIKEGGGSKNSLLAKSNEGEGCFYLKLNNIPYASDWGAETDLYAIMGTCFIKTNQLELQSAYFTKPSDTSFTWLFFMFLMFDVRMQDYLKYPYYLKMYNTTISLQGKEYLITDLKSLKEFTLDFYALQGHIDDYFMSSNKLEIAYEEATKEQYEQQVFDMSFLKAEGSS